MSLHSSVKVPKGRGEIIELRSVLVPKWPPRKWNQWIYIRKGFLTSVSVKMLVAQSWPPLCDLMNCSPPGSSVHGILQARILEWVAIPFFKGSFQPRNQTPVSCIAGRFFIIWAAKEAIGLVSGIPQSDSVIHICSATFYLYMDRKDQSLENELSWIFWAVGNFLNL